MKLQSTADGLKAVRHNPFDADTQYDEWCAWNWANDEVLNPPIDLTTPMSGNTVFEGVEVWQAKNPYNLWVDCPKEAIDVFNEESTIVVMGITETRKAYQPLEVKEQVREEAPMDFEQETQINLASGFKAHVMPEVDLVGFTQNNVNVGFDITFEQFIKIADQLKRPAPKASNPELGVAIRTPNYFLNIRMKDNDISLSGWEYDTVISAMLDYATHLKTLKQ